jgi:formylmethanofuran dehydrogenase subunit E
MTYDEVVRFHGHECPGIAVGYRMATAAMESLESVRAGDEELVAIVENDACGVDALQCVAGCTFGKGNLILRDYGKHVYTVYCRASRVGVRVLFHGNGAPEGLRNDRDAFSKWLLSAPQEDILSLERVSIPEPELARIRSSVLCAICGESVMESRVRQLNGRPVCIPCRERAGKRTSDTLRATPETGSRLGNRHPRRSHPGGSADETGSRDD